MSAYREYLLSVVTHLRVPWWIARGWAVDLHIGTITRPHADVDVLVLDRNLPAVGEALPAAHAERPETGEKIQWGR